MMRRAAYGAYKRRSVFTPAGRFGSALRLNLLLANFDATSDVWTDDSGYGHDASDVALSGFTKDGDGVIFDGANNRLDITNTANLDAGAAFADLLVAMILKPDVATGNHCPIARGGTGSGPWSVQTNAAALRFHVGVPGASFGEAASVLAAGTTVRVIWRYAGGGGSDALRLRCYANGSASSMSYPTGSIPTTIADSSNILRLGAFVDTLQLYDGRIKYAAMVVGHATSDQDVTDLDTYMATL